MDTAQLDIMEFVRKNGFAVITNNKQEAAVHELVSKGKLHRVPDEWLNAKNIEIYVSTNVTSQALLPYSLWKIIRGEVMNKGERVWVRLYTKAGHEAEVIGEYLQSHETKNGTVVEVSVSGSIIIVGENDLRKTYRE